MLNAYSYLVYDRQVKAYNKCYSPQLCKILKICLVQESFDFCASNISPTMTATLPSRGLSAVVMPPILGKYTTCCFKFSNLLIYPIFRWMLGLKLLYFAPFSCVGMAEVCGWEYR
jgi:hypothetical protein